MGTKGHSQYATIVNDYITCTCDIWFEYGWLHCGQHIWTVWLRLDDPNFKLVL